MRYSSLMIALFLLLPFALLGQQRTARYGCEAPDAVWQALHELDEHDYDVSTQEERRARSRSVVLKLADQHPGDLFVLMRLQYLDPGEFEKRVAALDDEVVREYFAARALIGANSDQAKTRLERLIERASEFPWPRLAMVEVLRRPRFKDQKLSQFHVLAFRELCPESLEGFGAVDRLHDTALAFRTAPQLRKVLEAHSGERTFAAWENLWNMEFRVRPVSEHAALRDQVRKDLKLLEAAGADRSFTGIQTLIEGYGLAGDSAGQASAEMKMIETFPNSRRALDFTVSLWRRRHARPSDNAPEEQLTAYWRAYYEAAGKWVERWPKSPLSWVRLYDAVRELEDLPAARVGEVADGFLRMLKDDPVLSSSPPYPLQIAELYVHRGILLDRVPALVEMALSTRRSGAGLDWDPGDAATERPRELGLRKKALCVLLDGYLKAKQFDKARESLASMERLVSESQPGSPLARDEELFHADVRAEFLRYQGKLAAGEKRRADAFAYFWSALAARPRRDKLEKDPMFGRARQLWKDLGGSKATWQVMAAELSARSARPVTVARDVLWKDDNRPLPDFSLADVTGKTWTKAALAGKVALVTVWATWCGPCIAELPYIEKLYQEWKSRDDIVILTLNIDGNPGVLGPFLQERKYTFPVLPAQGYVESVIPSIAIPRTWVVSPAGALRLEQLGFSFEQSYEDWKTEISQNIERVRILKPEP